MNVIRYKDLSDAHVVEQIAPRKTLYESFEGIDFSKHVLLVNGKKHNPDYIAKEGDLIVIRSIPGQFTDSDLVFIVATVFLGPIFGYMVGDLYKQKKQLSALMDQMQNVNDAVKNIPYLRGASNALATGKSQPYIIGEHLFTPYLVSTGYKTISGLNGADQFYYVVLEGGFNKQVLRKISADDVALRDWGTSLTTPQEGIYLFDADSVLYDADSLIEVAQDGAAFATSAFNVKIVANETGDQLKKSDDPAYEPLIYTLPLHSRNADVCIMFNGLRQFGDDGSKNTRTVVVTPSYSLNSGASWTDFTFDVNGTQTNTIAGNYNTQLRFNAHVDFTYAQVSALTEPVLIRVACSTPKFDGSAYDDVYVQWIQSLIYNPDASTLASAFVNEKLIDAPEAALSTLIGLKIKASQSNQDKLGKINVITSGVARTWSGSAWSAGKVPTRNPAAWLLEVLTSPTHLPSQVDDSEIDLDSFGALYDSCEDDSLFSDLVLSEGDAKATVFGRLCDICFSVLYKDIYGQISVINDAVRANAIAMLNTQNCISFENKKDLSRRVDGLKIRYINRDAGYEEDTYLVMRDGVTRGTETILRDMVVDGITTFAHVVRYARRVMAIESLRPKTVTAKVGKEGTYFTPLARVLVQHPSLKIGLGSAEVKTVISNSTHITGVVLYEPIEYQSTDPDGFGVIIQCVSETYSTQLSAAYTATTDGLVTQISFVVPIALGAAAVPHPGDILSYGTLNSGAFDTIASSMLITGIDQDKEGFTLSLVDYNTAIYDVGAIPAYVPNFTTRKNYTGLPETLPGLDPDTDADITVRTATEPVFDSLAHWSFDDQLATAIDNSAKGRHAAITDLTVVPGVVGSALQGNGSTSRVVPVTEPFVATIAALTVCAWLKGTPDTSEFEYFIHKGVSANIGDSVLMIGTQQTTGKILACVNGQLSAGVSPETLSATEWKHVTLRWNGTTVSVFVNGELSVSYALASITNTITGSRLCLFDSYTHSATRTASVSMDEPMAFDYALTDAQIRWLYKNKTMAKRYTLANWLTDAANATNALVSQTPKYLGKFLNAAPTAVNIGDTYTRYSATAGASNRGVFKWSGTAWVRTEVRADIMAASADISFIISYKNTASPPVAIYGTAADYTADSAIQADYAFFQSAFIGFLEANNIKVRGAIYGGDRFNAAGDEVDTTKNGFWQGALGALKANLQSLFRNNVIIGTGAGLNLINSGVYSNYNTIVGDQAGEGAAGAAFNSCTLIGAAAGKALSTGNGNNFHGQGAGQRTTTGGSNNFYGNNAGDDNVGGANNNFFGDGAGKRNTSGQDNIAIGNSAGVGNAGVDPLTTQNNVVCIGELTGVKAGAGDNQVNINNRFRYFEFPYGTLENVIYAAVTSCMRAADSSTGIIGHYAASSLSVIARYSTYITFYDAWGTAVRSIGDTTNPVNAVLQFGFINYQNI